ncbi:glucose-1-phosphate adenylyltransferase GlgD [Gottschalkia acidurici 9a]|uniref:Glucose-1-phosphate adenylyltransferase GlgD n=1 Tax=Gottschalkia acidurici (strain ATCC 7906 / DSM 604 / BCRC 14475 / CIP 104303 / KCTC 5404 / NCIMB 10678 / 9a) TaxID=1128398 RepID=K0AY20_GOTA9|nr:glucose-1-phosphate adenylyltransferase subunit GlgD [Gottschalkia acidurici]AFS77672.1 glucose-1-phosphate adenylyltransferase GlgD [Gottschalkia acidurici 9a]
MYDVLSIINNTKEEKRLNDIIKGRSLATIPFGGRYRLVDFHLSNMVNSGIQNVGILVRKNYRSLLGHVRSPKEWDLDRKKDGIFILPPDNENQEWVNLKGDLEVLQGNMDYLIRSKQQYVLITGANIICNIDYSKAVEFHRENNNDITVIYKKLDGDINDISSYTQIKIDKDEKIMDMEVNTNKISGGNVSLEMYIMSKDLLIDIVYGCTGRGEHDLVKDGIVKNLNKLKVYGYRFDGYSANINSIQSYYHHSMELLDVGIWKELFYKSGLIYTKMKDLAPAKYGKYSNVHNTVVANGCVIDGEVSNSIMFREVKIEKGGSIKNSIIMQGCKIEEGVVLENVIVDKDCYISKNQKIIGCLNYPIVVGKKTTI